MSTLFVYLLQKRGKLDDGNMLAMCFFFGYLLDFIIVVLMAKIAGKI